MGKKFFVAARIRVYRIHPCICRTKEQNALHSKNSSCFGYSSAKTMKTRNHIQDAPPLLMLNFGAKRCVFFIGGNGGWTYTWIQSFRTEKQRLQQELIPLLQRLSTAVNCHLFKPTKGFSQLVHVRAPGSPSVDTDRKRFVPHCQKTHGIPAVKIGALFR